MSAATFAGAPSDVIALTGNRIKRVSRDLDRSSLGARVGGYVLSAFDSLAASLLHSTAVRYKDNALWFRGASKEAWEDNLDVSGWIDQVIPRLEGVKSTLQTVREEFQGIQKKDSGATKTQAAINHCLASCTDLFEAIEEFRWTLLELEANHSELSTGFSARTAEEMDSLLAKLDAE